MKSYLGNPQPYDREKVNIEDLADIQDVKIDTSLPKEERIRSYLEQIKNPYCYRCGDIVIHVSYANTGETLENRMKHYLLSEMRRELRGDK